MPEAKSFVIDCRGFRATGGYVAEYEREMRPDEIEQRKLDAERAAERRAAQEEKAELAAIKDEILTAQAKAVLAERRAKRVG